MKEGKRERLGMGRTRNRERRSRGDGNHPDSAQINSLKAPMTNGIKQTRFNVSYLGRMEMLSVTRKKNIEKLHRK